MFLDNWYKLLKAYNEVTTQVYARDTTLVDLTGATVTGSAVTQTTNSTWQGMQLFLNAAQRTPPSIYVIYNGTSYFAGTSSGSAIYSGVIIGDGDTPPALSDYCLSGNQITDFTATTTISTLYNNGKLIGIATYNITNTGASPFTIKEIGLAKVIESSSPYNRVLVTRELLETPVTIAPGDTGVVTYKIEIS